MFRKQTTERNVNLLQNIRGLYATPKISYVILKAKFETTDKQTKVNLNIYSLNAKFTELSGTENLRHNRRFQEQTFPGFQNPDYLTCLHMFALEFWKLHRRDNNSFILLGNRYYHLLVEPSPDNFLVITPQNDRSRWLIFRDGWNLEWNLEWNFWDCGLLHCTWD